MARGWLGPICQRADPRWERYLSHLVNVGTLWDVSKTKTRKDRPMFRKPLIVAAAAIAGLSFTASADAKTHHRHVHRQMHAMQILPPSFQ
jgi:hypothetical protein